MHSFRKSAAVVLALVSIFVGGCGGNKLEQTTLGRLIDPMGEGNIPIGRAQGKEMGESAVQIVMSDGRVYNDFTQQQVVLAPPLPRGMTKVTITPANRRFAKYKFQYYVGSDVFYQFTIRPQDKLAAQVVKFFDSSVLQGATFKVGEKVDLGIKIYGNNIGELKPTLFVSGGIARIDEDDILVCTKPGIGQINIEVAGFERSISFEITR